MQQTIYEFSILHPGSLAFLLIYLPLYLFACYMVPARLRTTVLLCVSLHFYYMVAGVRGLAVMAGSVLLDYVAVQLMEHWDKREDLRKLCMAACAAKNLGLILLFGVITQQRLRPMTLGVQIYTLCALSCVWDIYRRESPYERDPIRFGLYCVFFPKLYNGPLMPYQDFASQMEGIRLEPVRLVIGAGQYVHGIFKMWVLGGSLYTLYRQIRALSETTPLSAWTGVLVFALMLYYLLGGLGDIAQGVGEMFSIGLPKNFYYPYQSRNVGDFFQRFNITIHQMIRDFLDGVGKGEESPLHTGGKLLAAGALAGLWFGLQVNYLLWGLYIGLFLVMERYLYPGLLRKTPVLFCRLGTLAVVLAGFPIFMGGSLSESGALIRSMFAFGGELSSSQLLYLLTSNWLLLVVSCFLATNAVNLLTDFFRKNAPRVATTVLGAVDVVILIIYFAMMV